MGCFNVITTPVSSHDIRFMMELGFFAGQAGRFMDAEMIFKGVLALRNDILPARIGLANVFLATGKLSAAASLYQEIAEQNPSDPYALVSYGEFLLLTRDVNKAEEYLMRTQSADPGGVYCRLAHSLMALMSRIRSNSENWESREVAP